jgi:hypothetical protein
MVDAMIEEYQSIIKNDVWEVVPRPKNKDVVSSKWIYKIKHAADEGIEKHKARFVARGFSQKEGIDYEETFAPVSRYTSIITIISLAAKMKWKLHQMKWPNFGSLSAPFQWPDFPEIQTLVFAGTRKPEPIPEVPVQKCAGQVSRGKTWNFMKQSVPANSPLPNASPGKFKFIF